MTDTARKKTGEVTTAICVKNGETTIQNALWSLCKQSLAPASILIIDDGSTDDTLKEIEKVESPIPVSVIPNDGIGLFDARSTALKNCGTEFLAFIDADCVADSEWVEKIEQVFKEHPEVGAGTGGHPEIGEATLVSRMHQLWFIVEGIKGAGYTGGVVGANSYFRTSVLNEVGGWVSLPMANAEDFYISLKITEAGHKIWIDEKIKVFHHFTKSFPDLMKKSFNSGYAITLLMRKTKIRGFWYNYTLLIPIVAFTLFVGVLAGLAGIRAGWVATASILLGTFLFNLRMFKTLRLTLPRWAVRWVIIWAYSAGILKALKEKY